MAAAIKLSKHFNLHEFECPCCGVAAVDPVLLLILNSLRGATGRPIIIHHDLGGAFRCPVKLASMVKKKKCKPTSQHGRGRAVDIHIPGHTDTRQGCVDLADLAVALGAGGVGIYPGWCHIDSRPVPPGGSPARWERKKAK